HLECCVADREHLIDQQYLGLDMGGYRKAEADHHPRRVVLQRLVDERLDFRESYDLVKLCGDLALAHAHDRPVEINVLPSREVGMEARSHLDQGADAAADGKRSVCRGRDAGEDLENRALAGAVRPDQSDGLAPPDLEAHVTEGPELAGLAGLSPKSAPRKPCELVAEGDIPAGVQAV